MQVRRQHEALTQRLLAVMRKIDVCEARVAPSLGLWDSTSAQAGSDILQTLDGLERRLAPRAPRASFSTKQSARLTAATLPCRQQCLFSLLCLTVPATSDHAWHASCRAGHESACEDAQIGRRY